MTVYGYARVSTSAQDLQPQIAALTAAGCEKVYSEKINGSLSDRPQLDRLLKLLQAGDTLVVTRIDRLARSTLHLLRIIETLTKRGAHFRSIADSWADTTTPSGNFMLTVMGGLAQFEKSLILERTAAGRARAMDLGVKFGRPSRLNDVMKAKIAERKEAGASLVELARDYDCSVGTVHAALYGRKRPRAAFAAPR
jgi:DNA invertase Pin-like site-specific DNA recombinase